MRIVNIFNIIIRLLTRYPNKSITALITAICMATTLAISITYTSELGYISIVKQLEKLSNDPGDVKTSDLIGLFGVCNDVRFKMSVYFTRDSAQKNKISRGCTSIKYYYEHLDVPKIQSK